MYWSIEIFSCRKILYSLYPSRQSKNIKNHEVRLSNRSIISPYEFTTCHEKRHSIPPNILDEYCQTQNSCQFQLHREKSERMESMSGMTKKKCGRCEDSSCDVRCRLFAEGLCRPSVIPKTPCVGF